MLDKKNEISKEKKAIYARSPLCSFEENNFSIEFIFNCLVSSRTTKNQRPFVIPLLIWPLKVNGCWDGLKKRSLKCVECIEN